jgi:3-dehydroquinate dehydratase-2
MTASSVLVLNGPNLNLLGTREPEVYGTSTLADVEALCRTTADEHDLRLDFRQSNHEGVLVDAIHEVRDTAAGIVINPAAYCHYSIALRDAMAAGSLPVAEVHLTNIHGREPFRHTTRTGEVADVIICGAGIHGYALAITHVAWRVAAERA